MKRSTHTPHNMHTHQQFLTQKLRPLASRCIQSPFSMPEPKNKAEWVKRILDEGYQVPTSWTVIQLQSFWAEIKMEKGEEGVKGNQLGDTLKMMRKAARKKSDLVNFMAAHNVTVTDNMTIAQMVALGEKTIYAKFEPHDQELVAFGKYANLTYQQVASQHPSYLQWIKTTALESDNPHWRLLRLHRWAEMQQAQMQVLQSAKTSKISTRGVTMLKDTASDTSFSMISETPEPNQEAQELARQWALLELEKQKIQKQTAEVEEAETQLRKATGEYSHKNRKEM